MKRKSKILIGSAIVFAGSGKLTSTNGYYGLRFAHNTDVFVSNLLATSTK